MGSPEILEFTGGFNPFVVDNVFLTPEASKALLMYFAMMGFLCHHRRRSLQALF